MVYGLCGGVGELADGYRRRVQPGYRKRRMQRPVCLYRKSEITPWVRTKGESRRRITCQLPGECAVSTKRRQQTSTDKDLDSISRSVLRSGRKGDADF